MTDDSLTSFAILAEARTASTWLCNHLSTFHQFTCNYEVFNPQYVYLYGSKHRLYFLHADDHAQPHQVRYDRLTELAFGNPILSYDEAARRLEDTDTEENTSRRTRA